MARVRRGMAVKAMVQDLRTYGFFSAPILILASDALLLVHSRSCDDTLPYPGHPLAPAAAAAFVRSAASRCASPSSSASPPATVNFELRRCSEATYPDHLRPSSSNVAAGGRETSRWSSSEIG